MGCKDCRADANMQVDRPAADDRRHKSRTPRCRRLAREMRPDQHGKTWLDGGKGHSYTLSQIMIARATAAGPSSHLMVPLPGLRINRFPYSPQNPQACALVPPDKGIPLAHKAADSCGCCVQLADLVPVSDVPHAACIWVRRHALKKHLCCSMKHGACNAAQDQSVSRRFWQCVLVYQPER